MNERGASYRRKKKRMNWSFNNETHLSRPKITEGENRQRSAKLFPEFLTSLLQRELRCIEKHAVSIDKRCQRIINVQHI